MDEVRVSGTVKKTNSLNWEGKPFYRARGEIQVGDRCVSFDRDKLTPQAALVDGIEAAFRMLEQECD